MFYNKEEYKSEISKFFDKNGTIIKLIDPDTKKLIGNLLRYEINSSNELVSIFVSISLFDDYKNNKNLFYTIKNLRYFGIKHMFKNEKNILKMEKFNINDKNFNELFLNKIKLKIKNDEIINFILNKIKNINNYYKNKDIIMFFM